MKTVHNREQKNLEEEIKRMEKFDANVIKNIKVNRIIIVALATVIIGMVLIYPIMQKPPRNVSPPTLNSGYDILNMKDEKVTTWIAWKIVPGEPFYIDVAESPEVTQARLDDIRDAIYSNDTEINDGQTYYEGWMGGLRSITTTEQFPIPIHFITMTTTGEIGNVVIHLTNVENGDGLSGYTKSIADENNHQILKSSITIYEVDKLNDNEFKGILRHELGHALGLAYSDNPSDLMHLTVYTNRAYISPCDIEAMESLYNGKEKNTITCTQ